MVTQHIEADFNVDVAIVYATIEIMDSGIEQISYALRRNVFYENTVFMFTCDNGPAFGVRWDYVLLGGTGDTTRFNCGLNGSKGLAHSSANDTAMAVRARYGDRQSSDDALHLLATYFHGNG